MIKKLRKILGKHSEILFAYLYGSKARGDYNERSDVDIGVYLSKDFKPDTFYEVKLAEEIEKNAKLKDVEVVILNNKPIRFLNQVLRYGKLIFSRDEKERVRFETYITKTYIDMKPYFLEYDRMRFKDG
ncbi:MAG: nucleotidyltransferase domain-containing protein [Thermoplasmata archaeon]|nr:MAG: nucleotidyltransferase domain-containing protein [Thermoplasmata archaeon]